MKNTLVLKLKGMDCASCVINIDSVLEDVAGVEEARTSYAKEQTSVTFNAAKVKPKELIRVIKEAGYEAVIVNSM
jgi:P-type Cu+ transporter